ncbi:MAG TPA: response regulator, partial [Polyangiales bacterium]
MAQAGVTVLIVDDDQGHSELVRRNLRRSGVSYELEWIPNGAQALDYVSQRGAHASRQLRANLLLLLDINMPGDIDGLEVLRRLKSDPNTRAIPIVMLTTTDDPREIDRCYELGCNAYVTKPIESAAFTEAIHRIGLW